MVVAPCFDKKLEAVREEFYNSLLETRDVDCVLTSGKSFRAISYPAVQVQLIFHHNRMHSLFLLSC